MRPLAGIRASECAIYCKVARQPLQLHAPNRPESVVFIADCRFYPQPKVVCLPPHYMQSAIRPNAKYFVVCLARRAPRSLQESASAIRLTPHLLLFIALYATRPARFELGKARVVFRPGSDRSKGDALHLAASAPEPTPVDRPSILHGSDKRIIDTQG